MERFHSTLSANEADENFAPTAKERYENSAVPVGVPAKQQSLPVLSDDFGVGHSFLRQHKGMVAEPVNLPADSLPITGPQRGLPVSRATVDNVTPAAIQLRDADIRPVDAETHASPQGRIGARTILDDTRSHLHMGRDDKGMAAVEYREPRMASVRPEISSIQPGSQRRQPAEKVSKTQLEPVLNAEVVEHSNSVVSSALRAEPFPDDGLLETPSRPSVPRQAVGQSDDRRGLVERLEVLPLAAAVAGTFPGRRAPEIAAEDTDRKRKVTVEIGRLEIRDQRTAPPPPQRAKASRLGLSEYLERRLGRGRHE